MIKLTVTVRQLADFAMPACPTVSGRLVTSERVLPTVGGVWAVAGKHRVDGTTAFGNDIADTAARAGASLGPSAWSPPI